MSTLAMYELGSYHKWLSVVNTRVWIDVWVHNIVYRVFHNQ